jgi:hypothetical protein
MSMNPALTEMVAHTRMADMQRAAVSRSVLSQRGVIVRRVAKSASPLPRSVARPTAARRAVGWFLVGVGLRLAVARPRPAATR